MLDKTKRKSGSIDFVNYLFCEVLSILEVSFRTQPMYSTVRYKFKKKNP